MDHAIPTWNDHLKINKNNLYSIECGEANEYSNRNITQLLTLDVEKNSKFYNMILYHLDTEKTFDF